MNEFDPWNAFMQTGRIYDYLAYKSLHDNKFLDEYRVNGDEDDNERTDNQGAEYRGEG